MIHDSTAKLVRIVAEVDFDGLPANVVHEAKRTLMDATGCGISGLATKKGQISAKLALALGGKEESTIFGCGTKVSCANAAFANGELINALDMDAVVMPGIHASPFVIPGALALAEKIEASGKDLIVSIALGHEIAQRMAMSVSGIRRYIKTENRIGFADVHGYGYAVIGGTIAAGKVLRLSLGQMESAIGIGAYNTPLPTAMRWANLAPANMSKYASAGWLSQVSVTAALLASLGYTGDSRVLDGADGFWKFSGSSKWLPENLLHGLGQEWKFLGTAYKIYPCCGVVSTALDLFTEIIGEHDLSPEEIESVSVLSDPMTDLPPWKTREVTNPMDAQTSVPFLFSLAAHRVPPTAEWQAESTIRRGDIRSFMSKVNPGVHPEFDRLMLGDKGANVASVDVIVRGERIHKEKTWFKGQPSNTESRLSDEELGAKFTSNAKGVLGEQGTQRLVEFLTNLETIENVSRLTEMLSVR